MIPIVRSFIADKRRGSSFVAKSAKSAKSVLSVGNGESDDDDAVVDTPSKSTPKKRGAAGKILCSTSPNSRKCIEERLRGYCAANGCSRVKKPKKEESNGEVKMEDATAVVSDVLSSAADKV